MDLNFFAPCGIDCVNCELFAANRNTAAWENVAAHRGGKGADYACRGCRENNGCSFFSDCKTLACIKEKGFDFCHECGAFPCPKLIPVAEGAAFFPHNMKMYNLCRLKAVGIDDFLAEAPKIRELYFKGKFVIGAGPQVSPKE